MTAQDIVKQILLLAQKHSAEFCEVVVVESESMLKRIQYGHVDQPPAGEQWGIDLALVKNKRRKSVSFDNPLFAEEMIKSAMAQMQFMDEQEIHIPSEAFSRVGQPKNLFDEETGQLNDKALVENGDRIAKNLEGHGLLLSGKIAQGRGEISYGNSLGTFQSAKFTLACAALFAFDRENPSISAYASSGGTSRNHIDVDRVSTELIMKCELARGKQKIDLFAGKNDGEDFRIDVIAEPYFFGPIFEWLGFFGFNGLLVERGESFLSNKVGDLVTGERVTIEDNPFDVRNRGMGLPFDFEGRPRKLTMLIDRGIAKNAVYDGALAQKWSKASTGNALFPSQRSEGASPFDLVMQGGTSSVEEMIQNVKRPTLWITKLHYLGMKHYQTATMTGIAQHGVFLVENGSVVAPVENVRFEESIPEALKRVESMSESRLVFDPARFGFPGGVVAPAIKIQNFRFVGSTARTI